MIIEVTEHTVDGITFNRLTSPNNYWGVGYENDMHVSVSADGSPLMSTPVFEDGVLVRGWLIGGTVTDGLSNGFGADTFEELWAEVKNRGIILPQEFLDHLESLGYT